MANDPSMYFLTGSTSILYLLYSILVKKLCLPTTEEFLTKNTEQIKKKLCRFGLLVGALTGIHCRLVNLKKQAAEAIVQMNDQLLAEYKKLHDLTEKCREISFEFKRLLEQYHDILLTSNDIT